LKKEIAAAKKAKKAAKETLKFAQRQFEEKVKREAEERAAAERKRSNEEFDKRLQKHEDQLTLMANQWQERINAHEVDSKSSPLRTTYVSEGSRRIEIAEYTKEKLEPFINMHFNTGPGTQNRNSMSEAMLFPYGFPPHWESGHARDIVSVKDSIYDSLGSSAMTRTDPQSPVSIMLPPHLDQESARFTAMRNALETNGIPVTCSAASDSNIQSLTRANEVAVQGTVFWEPPAISLGSELLGTMRARGWKPMYFRKSGMETAVNTYFAPTNLL